MRNNNLIRELRTDKNGVSRNVWVKPQQGRVASTLAMVPPSATPAPVMKQQKAKVAGVLLERIERVCIGAFINGKHKDRIVDRMTDFLDSVSEQEINVIHGKIVESGNGTVLTHAVSQMFVADTLATPQTIVEFLVLDEYHGYNPKKDYVERVQLFVMGLHSYENNRDPVDIDDGESIKRNGALLRFSMDAVDAMTGTAIVEASDEAAYRIRGEHVANLLLENPEMFLGNPENTKRLIGLITERGHEAAVHIFTDPNYQSGSPLNVGVL